MVTPYGCLRNPPFVVTIQALRFGDAECPPRAAGTEPPVVSGERGDVLRERPDRGAVETGIENRGNLTSSPIIEMLII